MIRYLSVCSGIEAATCAWHDLGWKPVAFSEIEAFPRDVLQHHYPDVPIHGDFTTIKEDDYGSINLLVGGTPCQAFSVAGLRKGFSDDRGNLTLEFIRLAQRKKPRWVVWENVPGVLSIDGGRAFGSFLGGLAECGYGFAYRILDAQYFGVPQRRRRVFVIGYFGDWRPPAAVLFEREGLCGDITPRRETGKRIADTLTVGANQCSGKSGDFVEVAATVCAKWAKGTGGPAGDECQNIICQPIPINTQVALRHNALGESTGFGIGESGDPAYTIQANHPHAVAIENPMAFPSTMSGTQRGVMDDLCPSLRTGGNTAIAWSEELTPSIDLAGTIQHGGQGGRHDGVMTSSMQVRRLTPQECERLQGFPDNYTLLPGRTADGARYKALGNSMAVPVMAWIGNRIQSVETARAAA
jgi:DNA (cytosine-5)-methyltransferase 1